MNLFEPKSVGWFDTPEYKAELEDFRRTKEKMDRERDAREAAEQKVTDARDGNSKNDWRASNSAKKLWALYALAQEICERIAIGELMINICLDEPADHEQMQSMAA